MHQLLQELEKRLPSDCERRVKSAKDEYNDLIRTRLREELRFNLQEQSLVGKGNTAIPIRVEPGHLSRASEFKNTPDSDPTADLISLWGADLVQLEHSSQRIRELLDRLTSYGPEWPETAAEYLPVLQKAADLSRSLQERARVATLLRRLFSIEEDILGIYQLHRDGTSEIVLYWAAVGVVAELLQVPLEDLAVVTLIHELAHGYTHLGKDIDNKAWDNEVMWRPGNRTVVEGVAQYYTEVISEYLGDRRRASIHHTYLALRRQQQGVYRIHDIWVNEFSSEVMRSALVKYRRQRGRHFTRFQSLLCEERERLVADPRPLHPRTQDDINANGRLLTENEVFSVYATDPTGEELDFQPLGDFAASLAEEWELSSSLPVASRASEWSVAKTSEFAKSLDKQDTRMRSRVFEAIMELMEAPLTPRGDTIQPLRGNRAGWWRYRFGDSRLVYEPDMKKRRVTLVDFDARGSIYKD